MGFDQFPKAEKFPDFYKIIFLGRKPDISISRDDVIVKVGAELEKDQNFKNTSPETKELRAFFAIDDYL
jgi:hypothetical protein